MSILFFEYVEKEMSNEYRSACKTSACNIRKKWRKAATLTLNHCILLPVNQIYIYK